MIPRIGVLSITLSLALDEENTDNRGIFFFKRVGLSSKEGTWLLVTDIPLLLVLRRLLLL